MTYDTSTPEGRIKKLTKLVTNYAKRRNWSAAARLMGGKPRYDLQDYQDSDAGEPPKGARW